MAMDVAGIDCWQEAGNWLSGRRVALLTNGAARDARGRRCVEALREGGVDLRLLFSPEHGLAGAAEAGAKVEDGRDAVSGLPCVSLYGSHSEIPEDLADGFDVLAADLPDVGVRYYTYPRTLFQAISWCRRHGKPAVLFDRANPLGNLVEGPRLDPAFASIVGQDAVPVRHGLTLGGYARFALNHSLSEDGSVELKIVAPPAPATALFPEFGQEWVPPSPNLRSFEALAAYPGTCLFEGTNVSEGRGTAAPFLLIGAPFVDPERLLAGMPEVPGGRLSPAEFTPAPGAKRGGELCRGVRIEVTDARRFPAFAVGLRLVDGIRRLHPAELEFLPAHFDRLMGSDRYRVGKVDAEGLLAEADLQCRDYCQEVGNALGLTLKTLGE